MNSPPTMKDWGDLLSSSTAAMQDLERLQPEDLQHRAVGLDFEQFKRWHLAHHRAACAACIAAISALLQEPRT